MQSTSGTVQQPNGVPAQNGTLANGHANGHDADSEAVLDILRSVKQCQQQRAQQYTAFNTSFRQFLDSKDETPYRQAMVEATQKFAEINVTVRSQERRLRQDLHKDDLADSLSALQKGEEAKLRFTLIQQALKQSASEGHFSWQNSANGTAAPAAHQHASASSLGSHGDTMENPGCCRAVAEPTEQEFNDALAEATQELQAAVTSINDILTELQEVEEDYVDTNVG